MNKRKHSLTLVLFISLSICLQNCMNHSDDKLLLRIISPYNRQYEFLVNDCKLDVTVKECILRKSDSSEVNLTNLVFDTIIKKYKNNLTDSLCMKLNSQIEQIKKAGVDTISFCPNNSYYHELYLNGKLKFRTQNIDKTQDILKMLQPMLPNEIKCCDYFEFFNMLVK